MVRFFPFAVVVLWPVVRLTPRELRETAQLDGATPSREFVSVALPLLAPAALQACVGVAVLSLGEVSASKLVETPGAQTFAHELFNQMHYGVQDRLAALCLVLLLAAALGGAAFAVVTRCLDSSFRAR
jgi:iron(III) transport system permease protein